MAAERESGWLHGITDFLEAVYTFFSRVIDEVVDKYILGLLPSSWVAAPPPNASEERGSYPL